MLTTRGDLPLEQLERTMSLEERPTALVLNVEYRLTSDTEHGGELVRRDAFRREAPRELPDADGMLTVALGGAHVQHPAAALQRVVHLSGLDSLVETVIVEEWLLGDVVVKRSPWVIAWQAGLVAETIAGGLG